MHLQRFNCYHTSETFPQFFFLAAGKRFTCFINICSDYYNLLSSTVYHCLLGVSQTPTPAPAIDSVEENLSSKENGESLGCDMDHHQTPGDCAHCQYALMRGNWCHSSDLIVSLMAYTTSLGNFLQFPFLCMKNGGGKLASFHLELLGKEAEVS